jgi:hypothetical protein
LSECTVRALEDYNLAMFLFASWLEGWTFKGRQRRFEQYLQKEYPWIFEKFDARIVPKKRYKQVLDYVEATVAVDDLFFGFVRGRGDFHVNVAPSHSPNDWLEFGQAIDLARNGELTRKAPVQMSDFQRMFEANLERLKTYFSREEYERSKRWRNLPINLPKYPNSL